MVRSVFCLLVLVAAVAAVAAAEEIKNSHNNNGNNADVASPLGADVNAPAVAGVATVDSHEVVKDAAQAVVVEKNVGLRVFVKPVLANGKQADAATSRALADTMRTKLEKAAARGGPETRVLQVDPQSTSLIVVNLKGNDDFVKAMEEELRKMSETVRVERADHVLQVRNPATNKATKPLAFKVRNVVQKHPGNNNNHNNNNKGSLGNLVRSNNNSKKTHGNTNNNNNKHNNSNNQKTRKNAHNKNNNSKKHKRKNSTNNKHRRTASAHNNNNNNNNKRAHGHQMLHQPPAAVIKNVNKKSKHVDAKRKQQTNKNTVRRVSPPKPLSAPRHK